MAGFIERDLPHQTRVVTGVLNALEGIAFSQTAIGAQNPIIELTAAENLLRDNLEGLRKARGFQQAYKVDPKSTVCYLHGNGDWQNLRLYQDDVRAEQADWLG